MTESLKTRRGGCLAVILGFAAYAVCCFGILSLIFSVDLGQDPLGSSRGVLPLPRMGSRMRLLSIALDAFIMENEPKGDRVWWMIPKGDVATFRRHLPGHGDKAFLRATEQTLAEWSGYCTDRVPLPDPYGYPCVPLPGQAIMQTFFPDLYRMYTPEVLQGVILEGFLPHQFSFALFWRLNQVAATGQTFRAARRILIGLWLVGLLGAMFFGIRSLRTTSPGEAVGILLLFGVLAALIFWPSRRSSGHTLPPIDRLAPDARVRLSRDFQRFRTMLQQEKLASFQETTLATTLIRDHTDWQRFQEEK